MRNGTVGRQARSLQRNHPASGHYWKLKRQRPPPAGKRPRCEPPDIHSVSSTCCARAWSSPTGRLRQRSMAKVAADAIGPANFPPLPEIDFCWITARPMTAAIETTGRTQFNRPKLRSSATAARCPTAPQRFPHWLRNRSPLARIRRFLRATWLISFGENIRSLSGTLRSCPQREGVAASNSVENQRQSPPAGTCKTT